MDRAPADRRRFQRVGDAEEDVWGASEHGQLRAGMVFPGFFNRPLRACGDPCYAARESSRTR